ncbi:hypothetical protein TIFTF001_017846 [Ficus carica]|uniref:Uncharacterized protein n=1 Tax=Ficus carica TaxID=3494 RepID=A0AA88ABE1_FICCA|nr:hypothetical protein TIFTF001_017846 [Ficus carica]
MFSIEDLFHPYLPLPVIIRSNIHIVRADSLVSGSKVDQVGSVMECNKAVGRAKRLVGLLAWQAMIVLLFSYSDSRETFIAALSIGLDMGLCKIGNPGKNCERCSVYDRADLSDCERDCTSN